MSSHVDRVSADIMEDMRSWVGMEENAGEQWVKGSHSEVGQMDDYEILAYVDANYGGGAAQYVSDNMEAWS